MVGCGHVNKQLKEAGKRDGKVNAEKKLPDLPEHCREKFYSGIKNGDDLEAAFLLLDLALYNQHKRLDSCAEWYDNIKRGFESDEPLDSMKKENLACTLTVDCRKLTQKQI